MAPGGSFGSLSQLTDALLAWAVVLGGQPPLLRTDLMELQSLFLLLCYPCLTFVTKSGCLFFRKAPERQAEEIPTASLSDMRGLLSFSTVSPS